MNRNITSIFETIDVLMIGYSLRNKKAITMRI